MTNYTGSFCKINNNVSSETPTALNGVFYEASADLPFYAGFSHEILDVNIPNTTLTSRGKVGNNNGDISFLAEIITTTENVANENSFFIMTTNVFQVGMIASGVRIIVNDFLGTIRLDNVPEYANDAAAIAAGLSTGSIYKSTSIQDASTYLNIVP